MDRLLLVCLIALALGAAPAGASSRLRELLDFGWRFHLGDAPDAWQPAFADAGWRKVDLPHDWSVEDLPPEPASALPALSVTAGSWRFREGDDPSWKQPSLDDSDWQEVQLPDNWEHHSGYTADNVYGWYRRRITIPTAMRGKDILLLVGKVDDVDETFVNGTKIGGLGTFPPNYQTAWDQPRRYRVPAKLLKGDGTDIVAVRAFDGAGNGGLYAAVPLPEHSGPFDSEAEGGTAQGYTVGGVGWYRKTFTLPETHRGKRFSLTFDGAYMRAQIWFNGEPLEDHPYGYTGFHADVTPLVRFDKPNVVAVRLDTSGKTSRWYSGSGIYRHVWLTATNPVHIEDWGPFVTTPKVTSRQATVHVHADVTNSGGPAFVKLETSVVDSRGARVGTSASQAESVPAGVTRAFDLDIIVNQPKLWSPDQPYLYRLQTKVIRGSKTLDSLEIPFGIRSISVDAEKGFQLNGKPLKLRGGCVHHDNGCLGACTYDRAEERRVELLKAAGFNAIRTAHNPPSPAFLDACDRVGMVVMDEAFDCWDVGKNPNDYGGYFDQWWQRDVQAMVLRDRNHPSVVFWSIGNEIPQQSEPSGAKTGAKLAKYVRSLDPTRPVAQAAYPDDANWRKLDPLFANLDVCGYNYMAKAYVPDHKRKPQRVMVGTESMPLACAEHWAAAREHPYVIGDFVWTSFDYLGEAGIGKTPGDTGDKLWTVACCGDLDLCGWKRPQCFYREAVWGIGSKLSCFAAVPGPGGVLERAEGWSWPDERASWNWPGREGKPTTIRAYSSYPQVRLLLNGKDLGTKKTARFAASWDVPYEPGELLVIGLDSRGTEMERCALRTTAKPVAIRLTPDHKTIRADGQDLCFVTVEVMDSNGALVPNAEQLLRFSVTGPGKIVGVGNGDPQSVESFQQPRRKAFHGRCMVVIKANRTAGNIVLRAKAPGLEDAEIAILGSDSATR